MTKRMMRSRPSARWTALALTLCATLAVTLGAPVPARAGDPAEEANKRLIREYVEECMDGGDLDCLADYWIDDKAPRVRKSEELRRSYFPDLGYAVEDLLTDGDRVVVVLRVTGHHTGRGKPAHGDKKPIPPSGGELDLEEVVVYTVSRGRIRAGELFSDRLPIAQTMGYTITPPDGP